METTFASPSRADPERFKYARACLSQGLTYPAAARAAGVNEQDLRERVEGFSANRKAPQAAWRSPLDQCAGILSSASPEECGQVAAIALALLTDLSGPNAARIAVANIMASLPSLAAYIPPPVNRVIARDVADYVASEHELTFDQLRSVLRIRGYARPRQIAMYTIKRLCPHMSYPAIGRLLGNRDHTTIISGERKIAELIQTDPNVAASVADVLARFAPQAMRDAA